MQDARIAAVRDRLHAAADDHAQGRSFTAPVEDWSPVGPIGWLRTRLGLTATEELVLWLLIAHELCPHARRFVRELNSEPVPDPTLDTIRRVVYCGDARAWRELGPSGALQRLALIEWIDGTAPEHRRTLRVASRVLALVHDEVALDPELADCATLHIPLSSLLEIAPGVTEKVDAAIAEGDDLVVLHGAAGTGRRSLLAALARARGHVPLQINARSLSTDRDQLKRQLRLIARECRLLDVVPLILHLDDLTDRLDLIESELTGLVLATSSRAPARRWKSPPTVIELPTLSGTQLASLWSRVIPGASTADADLLATMYPLAPALVEAVGAVAHREAAGAEMRPEHIEAGVRAVLDDRLAGLATRITVTQTWDDLILPDDQTTAVVELLARIRRRRRVYEEWGFAKKLSKGLGVSALFSGPPGTGKTMCAGLIANDL
ncbi:MAG: hypothetical protein M4D80_03135, partial [Myxococcota bacterium]|nr:hypothetical protein [Myxococcota bacterium]